jgi:molybdate transport system substrate-binding protein
MDIGRRLLGASAALLLLSSALTAHAADLRIVATPSISGVIKELEPRFEAATGNKLVIQYGLTVAQKQNIEAGNFDLAISPSDVIDQEIAQGKIAASTRIDIAKTGLGVGMRAGARKPSLATAAHFKRAMLKARSVAYVTKEPSGQHINQDFATLTIADAMAAKTLSKESIGDVWKSVASGDAEMGIGFMPNVLSTPGVEAVGLFPAKLQFYTRVTAGIGVAAQQPDAAKAFIKYLLAHNAQPVLRANGFEAAAP